ncbi:exosortase C-terminal domain/associated protein EpsI [Phycisphaerales bacterium AB-hyl4]|uniref:Exosortase C-terminal domain/associated protein EpsI n=1 Tax=Natronomicrosphaera hydrolytica TaxID=3242702 RepID=A0ABV4U6R9_9BACT
MIKAILAPILAVALIAGLTIEKHSWPQPDDVEEYHAEVAEAIRAIPEQFGDWRSTEVELPMAAVALLRPNEILSRRYRNSQTGQAFQFIVIHCRDARDMVGHYPPNCYPAAGWDLRQRHNNAWALTDLTSETEAVAIEGVGYEFEQLMPGSTSQLFVTNLIILPDGTFGQSMRDVNRIAADRQFRVYGAAQMQFIFSGSYAKSERDQIVEQFAAAAEPAMQAIRTGVQR